MSKNLPVLAPDNPCNGCESSCCDPVTTGTEGYLPLNYDDPYQIQGISLEVLSAMRKFLIQDILQSLVGVNQGYSFFNPVNYSIIGRPVDGGYVEIGKEREKALIGNLEFESGERVRVISVMVVVGLSCDHFRNGICEIYEDRPKDVCESYSPKTCGRSKGDDPALVRERVARIKSIQDCGFSDIATAIIEFTKRMSKQY